VPFCRYKCSFCHYAVLIRSADDSDIMERYVASVRDELAWVEPGTRLSQLFVGGGTPTALPPHLLEQLLQVVTERVDMSQASVNVCESSPETVTAHHAEVMARNGIGRVSMGVQSLDEGVLEAITRRHSVRQAEEAIRMLAGTGLIVNVDLIYGLPGQTADDLRRDVLRASELGVHSLTLYELRLGERTLVGATLAENERLDLDRLIRWRSVVRAATAEAGFVQTRWHTYKREEGVAKAHRWMPTFDATSDGFQFGVGNSARSHLGYKIYRNVRAPQAYMKRIAAGESPVEEVFELDDEDRRTMSLARSIGDGGIVDRAQYEDAFGRSFDRDYGPRLERLVAADLVWDDGDRIGLTETGRLVHDRVTMALYPPRAIESLRAKGDVIDRRIRERVQRRKTGRGLPSAATQ
jgi:oxygen-independent coproporphyrinogen-3 oxidase